MPLNCISPLLLPRSLKAFRISSLWKWSISAGQRMVHSRNAVLLSNKAESATTEVNQMQSSHEGISILGMHRHTRQVVACQAHSSGRICVCCLFNLHASVLLPGPILMPVRLMYLSALPIGSGIFNIYFNNILNKPITEMGQMENRAAHQSTIVAVAEIFRSSGLLGKTTAAGYLTGALHGGEMGGSIPVKCPPGSCLFFTQLTTCFASQIKGYIPGQWWPTIFGTKTWKGRDILTQGRLHRSWFENRVMVPTLI